MFKLDDMLCNFPLHTACTLSSEHDQLSIILSLHFWRLYWVHIQAPFETEHSRQKKCQTQREKSERVEFLFSNIPFN